MLRAIRAETRRRTGRLVSYAEVANLLGEEIEKLEADNEKIRLAKQDLLEALRSSKLHVWAKREVKPNTLNPSAQFEKLLGSAFMDDCLTLNNWGTVGADPERPMARYHYQGPTYREARFQTNDVLAVWPAAGDAEPAVGVVGLTVRSQRRAPGGAPPRHDWDAFWIEVCIWSEANGFEERDRPALQKLMQDWTAKKWSEPPDASTIRKKLAQLYKRSREAR
jgi:hypothetical protein